VRASQRFLEPRKVLLDAGARVFTEQGGDHVRKLAARGAVLQ
jgi:hypothetical protein